MNKPIDECEVRDGAGGWITVGIFEALGRRGEAMRCPECLGQLQPHREETEHGHIFNIGLGTQGVQQNPGPLAANGRHIPR